MSEDKREHFMRGLRMLLNYHEAVINVADHWRGYPECGQDIRATVEFDDYKIADIELGTYIDKEVGIDRKREGE